MQKQQKYYLLNTHITNCYLHQSKVSVNDKLLAVNILEGYLNTEHTKKHSAFAH